MELEGSQKLATRSNSGPVESNPHPQII